MNTTDLKSIKRTRRLLNFTLWLIVLGTIFYSLMTSTPLVASHSEWQWSGWALGFLVDAAFILSISADATLSRYGMTGGKWPAAFRWVTGMASLYLNVWASIEARDWVGVGIHLIPPAILICAAEVAPIYRRKFRELERALSDVHGDDPRRSVHREDRAGVHRAGEEHRATVQGDRALSYVERSSTSQHGSEAPERGSVQTVQGIASVHVLRPTEGRAERAPGTVQGDRATGVQDRAPQAVHAPMQDRATGVQDRAPVQRATVQEERATQAVQSVHRAPVQDRAERAERAPRDRATEGVHRAPQTAQRDVQDTVRQCFEQGLSAAETARLVGRDRSSVSRQFKRLREQAA